jgi:hypothetical protein
MRSSSRGIGIILLACVLLSLWPAAALGRSVPPSTLTVLPALSTAETTGAPDTTPTPPPPAPLIATAMRLAMGPSTVSYMGNASVRATLVDASGTVVPKKRVVLQRSADASVWTTVTTMYSTTGAYATDVTVVERTCFRIVFRGDARYLPSTSGTSVIHARAYLTAPLCSAKVVKGTALGFIGYIKPKHLAGKNWVTLEAEQFVNGQWKAIKTYGTTTANNYSYSKYSGSAPLPYTGSWRIRATHSDAGHVRTVSG